MPIANGNRHRRGAQLDGAGTRRRGHEADVVGRAIAELPVRAGFPVAIDAEFVAVTVEETRMGAKGKSVAYLLKGMNNRSEMYSCFKAEVELDDDPTTKLNAPLIAQIAKHETVVCCGQAKSHCVNYSVRDMVAAWPEGTPKSNLVLLKDACSPVISFEKAAAEFEADVAAAGVRVTTTDDF